MKRLSIAAFVLAMFGLGQVSPAAAQTPTRAAINAACKPGADPQTPGDNNYPGGLSAVGSGLTPQTLPGATTVSAREAKCIIDKFGAEVVVLAAMNGSEQLPGALNAYDAASNSPTLQAPFATALDKVARGDKNRPIIVYCHHDRCFLSYNVALRAVQAGYRNVFWMRPGIAGWKAASYPLAGSGASASAGGTTPARPENLQRVRAGIERCRKEDLDYTAEDWAQMLTQIPSQTDQDKAFIRDRDEKAKWYKLCLSNVARDANGPQGRAEANKALAAADGEIAAMFNAARREVESNPAKYLSMTWDAHRPSALRADLATLKGVKTLEQACGSFDFSQPAITGTNDNNNYVRSLNERRIQYGSCLQSYREDSRPMNKTFGLTSANKWVKATRRFTCASTANRPNCIPNEPFNTIAGIATDANVDIALRQDKLFWAQRSRIDDLIRRGNAWIDEVNRRVRAFNAGY